MLNSCGSRCCRHLICVISQITACRAPGRGRPHAAPLPTAPRLYCTAAQAQQNGRDPETCTELRRGGMEPDLTQDGSSGMVPGTGSSQGWRGTVCLLPQELPASPTRAQSAQRGDRDRDSPEGQPCPGCSPAASGGAPPPAGKPLHSTDPPMPQDFHLIPLMQRCPGVPSRRLGCDLSQVEAAAQEHPPRGWALLPSPQLSFQPPALHRKDHQIIYRRCQLQATAKREVYLRHRVDCYTRS